MRGLAYYGIAGVTVQFVLLTLFCYRVQRIVTADTWYPTQAFRKYLDGKSKPVHKAGRQNLWTELDELFGCPFCFGWWTCLAVFAVAAQLFVVPLPAIQAVAASGIVGFIGLKEE